MKTVIILTQPRSGSSLLAGILHHIGVYMGEEKELLRGKYKNKLGSFEDHRFLAINHNILFRAERLMFYHNRFSDEDGKVEAAVKEYEDELKEYIDRNCKNESSRIFEGQKNYHLSARTVQEIIKKAKNKAGIKKNVHPHTLRHSFATHLIENGNDVVSVQSLLGHNNTQTTMTYVHMAAPNMINVKSPFDKL